MDERIIKTNLWNRLAIGISFLVGIAFRIYHLFIVGFEIPYKMGGLFYQMSSEIIKNRFLLPVSIPYYFPGGLPFAYPPLPFYIQAIVIKLFSPPIFSTVNILPPFISILSLVAFYFLARNVIENKVGVVAAVFTFAIIPIAFTEQIEAMGLAESLGTLALILYSATLFRLEETQKKFAWMMPGLYLGVCILSSPGSIYASILISILFFGSAVVNYFRDRNSKGVINCLMIGIMGVVISSPYWLAVISHHGIGIYLQTFSEQNSNMLDEFLSAARGMRFIQVSPFWNILFLYSLLSVLIKRRYLLTFFSIVLMPIPREFWVMSIPASLVIGVGIVYLLERITSIPKINHNMFKVGVTWVLILFFVIDSGFNLILMIYDDMYDISVVEIRDLREIKNKNIIPIDQFVLVVGNWGLVEWSPALLEREVINNPYGLEWLLGSFKKNYEATERLLEMDAPDSIKQRIIDDFDEVYKVYIVANRDFLDELEKSETGELVLYETIQEYENLGVGILNFQK